MVGNNRRSAILCSMTAVLAVGVSACAPDTPYAGPSFAFLSSYKAAQAGAPVLLSNAEWWLRLKDPVLDRLVALALTDSLSLALARERVIEARAEQRRVPGLAALNSSAGAQLEGTGSNSPDTTGTAQLGLNWLLDPYGARREQLKAAGARVEVADAEVDAAQLLVLFSISNAYVELRYRQRLQALRQQELRGRQQTLALTQAMQVANSATRLEITRSQARVAELQSQLPDLAAAISAKKNEIAVLAGVVPGGLPPDLTAGLDKGSSQPRPDLSPDVGIPADLLRNRPDIRIAERRYYAALAEIGQARADLYPRLSLSGAITLNALERGGSGTNYYFGPRIQFPSLPTGQARAAVEARHSQARQAHSTWESTVLNAILEVENALLDYKALSSSLQSAAKAARLYRETLDLTREVFRRGDATLGDLIDAEQAVASADQALADTLYRRGQSFVALNVRLGSGHAAARPGN
ncbi:MAG: efflux transporter outer membrane subunit [Erythrobacter sp.]|nr:efflux transporter outer membrane subunit [Erythrobacter sp.]